MTEYDGLSVAVVESTKMTTMEVQKTATIVLIFLCLGSLFVYYNFLAKAWKPTLVEEVDQMLLNQLEEDDQKESHRMARPKWQPLIFNADDISKRKKSFAQPTQKQVDKDAHLTTKLGNLHRKHPKNSDIQVNNNIKLPLSLQQNSEQSDQVRSGKISENTVNKESLVTGNTQTIKTRNGSEYNVISMSLWGNNPRYTTGALENVQLVKKYFPGWKIRVYMEMPGSVTRFEPVPNSVLDSLKEQGAETFFMHVQTMPIPPMMWRFLVVDDLSVDHFIVRDSDSRLSARDASAVDDWLKSGQPFHCIRDHPSHSTFAVSGGLWGGHPKELQTILQSTFYDLTFGKGNKYIDDMAFLQQSVWPRVKDHAYCTDSVSCDTWPSSYPFNVARQGYEHCGAVYDEKNKMRWSDGILLAQLGDNKKCVPKTTNLSPKSSRWVSETDMSVMKNTV